MFRAISGPTGVGKTDVAISLIQKHPQYYLVNADAFQFYKEIPTISNRDEFPAGIKSVYFGERSLQDPWSAGEFAKHSEIYLDRPALWVGTGLYLCSALYGLDEDRRKGTPFQGEPKRDFRILVLSEERTQLYEDLNRRVDQMLEGSAEDEAYQIFLQLRDGGLRPSLPSLKAIGLQHLLTYFRGEIDKETAIETWKRDSRRLAKRQITWLKKFCPPSERCLWLTRSQAKAQLSQLADFLEF